MNYIADLHIHSYLSRACSRQLHPEPLYRWCQLKGVTVLSTGDATHPAWIKELKEKLVPTEPGLFALRPDLAAAQNRLVPSSCQAPVRFLLGVEISCIYKQERVRRVHHLIFFPSFEAADRFNAVLGRRGNLLSDGRPIIGLNSRELLSLVLDADPRAALIPAHVWTPHFGAFGSQSGFDSLEECFGDLAGHIFAAETGLSSDPPMNWRLSALDRLTLISNSDAHSPEKIGREANVFNAELSFDGMFNALRRRGPGKLAATLEFFPEEGKYHADGHRACQTRLDPAETLQRRGNCPECGKGVTVGVLHRVEKLATHPMGRRPAQAAPYESIVPLKEVMGQSFGVGPASRRVDREYHRLLERFGNELSILRTVPIRELEKEAPLIALGIDRMRRGEVRVEAGYDGEYGTISVLHASDRDKAPAMSS